jgi:hypothetical protein
VGRQRKAAKLLDQPEVFISYSRIVPGEEPAVDAAPEAVTRWRERSIAAALLAPLTAALTARGWHVWRDSTAMVPGDELHHHIDAALLSCGGAVVLIDHAVLDRSTWVRWESGILTWRKRIGMPVRIVPVWIGIKPQDLVDAGYGPVRIDDLLSEVIDPDALDPSAPDFEAVLETHAASIAASLGELEADPSGPVALWVDQIADCLPASDKWIVHLARELGDRGRRLHLSNQPGRVMARELITAEEAELPRLLRRLAGFALENANQLKRHLEPVWLPADAATMLPEVTARPEGERVIAVNAREPATGTHLIRRCFPDLSAAYQVLEVMVTAVLPEDAVAQVRAAIAAKWPGGPAKVIASFDNAFLVLAFGGAPPGAAIEVIDTLRAEYPALTFVVMTQPGPADVLGRLLPDLPDGADDRASGFTLMLSQLLLAG